MKTVTYEVPVTIAVRAEKGNALNVMKTVQEYLRHVIPDEGPKDAIHMFDFNVGQPKVKT